MSAIMHSDRVSTTGSEGRKSSKPIMEKKRRARINASLAELKSLLLEVIKKEGARHNKMEKADILEMAVKYLRQIQRQQYTTSGGADPTLSDKYRLGFNECVQEVGRYLGHSEDDDFPELRASLLNHLANCVTGSDSFSPLSTPSTSPAPSMVTSSGADRGGSGVAPLAPVAVRVGGKAGFGSGGSPIGGQALIVSAAPPEINNNVATLANNNVLANHNNNVLANNSNVLANSNMLANNSNVPSECRVLITASEAGFRGVINHQVTTTASQPAFPMAVTTTPAPTPKVELQMVPPKPGSGEVAFVLPANMMSGGQLQNYFIPVFASAQGLTTSGVSLAPNAHASSAVPVPLSVMAALPAPTSTASGLVTLTPGQTLTSALVQSPSGHVMTAGVNSSMAWQPVTASSQPSSFSPPSATLVASSPDRGGPLPSPPSATVTSSTCPEMLAQSPSSSLLQAPRLALAQDPVWRPW